jgi:hypothetical protein
VDKSPKNSFGVAPQQICIKFNFPVTSPVKYALVLYVSMTSKSSILDTSQVTAQILTVRYSTLFKLIAPDKSPEIGSAQTKYSRAVNGVISPVMTNVFVSLELR